MEDKYTEKVEIMAEKKIMIWMTELGDGAVDVHMETDVTAQELAFATVFLLDKVARSSVDLGYEEALDEIVAYTIEARATKEKQ